MPLMPLSVMRPILHTMIPLLHTLTPLPYGLKAMIRETVGGTRLSSTSGISTLRALCREVGYPEELCITVCCTALAVLWMALHKEKFSLLATSLQAAAGVTGNQRWALILSSSARVSLVTYTAVIAVHHGFDLSLPTRLMILTDQVTCFSHAEGTVHFWLVDPWSGRFFDPAAAGFLTPIGLEHFFDMQPLRVDAAAALLDQELLHSLQNRRTTLPSIGLQMSVLPLSAMGTRHSRGFIQVAILLSFIIERYIRILHPFTNRAVPL